MKKKGLIILFTFYSVILFAEVNYNAFFTNKVLRVDLVLSGNKTSQMASVSQVYEEKQWGGRTTKLDEFHGKGTYKYDLYDLNTGKLIYTDGFSTLFQEWQTTDEAENIERSMENTIYAPLPQKDVRFVLVHRVDGLFTDTLLNINLNPEGEIVRPTETPDSKTKDILISGKTDECIDIVLIAEGYTKYDEKLFFEDAQNFADALFTSKPFAENKGKFNIRAVMSYSEEEGADDPEQAIYVKTALNSSYNTLYSDRYLMTNDLYDVSNYASLVPHDQIIILVNSEKYGGGGIYNFYSINSTRGRKNQQVFIHEFGHSFAGLADEYYTSDVSYNDFFPADIEPWEPNVTTLVDFDSKWKDMLDQDTPVPTPAKNKYKNTIGVYEGGGYVAKGVYRPFIDCRMKTNEAEDFCPVCARAIVRTINFYTKGD
ncbi:M64 family metallopeptidase [Saccharicrinis sp. FJH62]|uniref:M64 family metallopeptidase n=1 Tax=Saccharicrinis sp. FJH62 TaxID=3344657 RepID=UPI0035D4F321